MAAVCPQGLVDVFLQYRNFAAAMFPDGRRKFLARVLPGDDRHGDPVCFDCPVSGSGASEA
jgi:hypothetical protein